VSEPAIRIEAPRVTLGSAAVAIFAIWSRIEIGGARQAILIQEIDKRVARIERRLDRTQ
jgi:hypothetical protein